MPKKPPEIAVDLKPKHKRQKRAKRKTDVAISGSFPPAELRIRGMVRRARLAILSGHPLAMTEITNQFIAMLWRMGIRAAKHDNDTDDFVNLAYFYFVDCVRTFDFRRGVKFITHCYARIPLQLLRPRADYHELIHVPACAYLEGVRAPKNLSLSRRAGSGGGGKNECDDDFSDLRIRSTRQDDVDPIDELIRAEEVAKVREAIAGLPTEEREIITARMNDLTLKEIGEKFGFSKERVRQIETAAKQMIKHAVEGTEEPAHLKRRRGIAVPCKRGGRRVSRRDELPLSAAG